MNAFKTQVSEKGEAGRYPTLCQQDVHIVSVGLGEGKEESAADELLRQLMTLPRPVRVEFAKTKTPTPSSPPTRASSPKPGHALQRAESATTQPVPLENDPSGKEPNGDENAAGENEGEGGMKEAEKNPEDGTRETDSMNRQSPAPAGEGGRRQGGNEGCRDKEDEERLQQVPWRPQRRGTLPDVGWQAGPVDSAGVDHDENIAGQGERAEENGGDPHSLTDEGGPPVGEERRHGSGPSRPHRHGTLPGGSDWEENLRRGYCTAASAAAATAQSSVGGEGSEGTSWSMAEEANFRSSPTNGSYSPTRSFHSPNARRSRLVLTPDGSDSSVWSRGHTDGVESIQRWLHVRIRFLDGRVGCDIYHSLSPCFLGKM